MAKFNDLVLYGDDLFTKTQQRVLSLLYGRPEQTFYLNQIVRLAAVGKIDLMLVGDDMSYSEVMDLLAPAEKQLGRTINPTLYTVAEFTDRKTNHQPFIQRVIEQPKLWLVGDMELKN